MVSRPGRQDEILKRYTLSSWFQSKVSKKFWHFTAFSIKMHLGRKQLYTHLEEKVASVIFHYGSE
jgi:hypothetical protein